jgi:hypothetical protein
MNCQFETLPRHSTESYQTTMASRHSIPERVHWIPCFCQSSGNNSCLLGASQVWNTLLFWNGLDCMLYEHLDAVTFVGFLWTLYSLLQCSWESARLVNLLILSYWWHTLLSLHFGGIDFSCMHCCFNSMFSFPHLQTSTTDPHTSEQAAVLSLYCKFNIAGIIIML